MASLSTAVVLLLALSTSLAFPQRPMASYNNQMTSSQQYSPAPVGYYLVPIQGGGRMGSFPQFGSPYGMQQPQYIMLNPGSFAQQYNPAQNRMDIQNQEVHKLKTLFPFLVNAINMQLSPSNPLFLINPPYRPNKPINLSYRPDKPNKPSPGHLINLPYYTTQKATGPTPIPIEFEGGVPSDRPDTTPFTTESPLPIEFEGTTNETTGTTDFEEPITTQEPDTTDYDPIGVHLSYPPYSKPITTTHRPYSPYDHPIGGHHSYPTHSKPNTTLHEPYSPYDHPVGDHHSYPSHYKPTTTTQKPYSPYDHPIGGHNSYPTHSKPNTTTQKPYSPYDHPIGDHHSYPSHYKPTTTTQKPYSPYDQEIVYHHSYPSHSKPITTTQKPYSSYDHEIIDNHSYQSHYKPITTTRKPHSPYDHPIGHHHSNPSHYKPITTTYRPNYPYDRPNADHHSYSPHLKPITVNHKPNSPYDHPIEHHHSYPSHSTHSSHLTHHEPTGVHPTSYSPYSRPITSTPRPHPTHQRPITTTRRPYFNHGTASWDHTSTPSTTVDINWEQWDEGRKPTNVKPGSPKDAYANSADTQTISEAAPQPMGLVNNPSSGPVYVVLGQMPQMGYYDYMGMQQMGASNYLSGQQEAMTRSGYDQNVNFVPFRPASRYRSHVPTARTNQKPLVGMSYAYPNLFTRQQSYDNDGYEEDEGVVVEASKVRQAPGEKGTEEKGDRVDTEKVEAAGPAGPSVAQAKPQAIAMAGPGGVAAATPMATAVVGPGGMAVAAPSATAVAGPSGGKPPISVGSNAALTAAYKAQMKAERKQDQFSAVSLGGRLVSPVSAGQSDGMYAYGL